MVAFRRIPFVGALAAAVAVVHASETPAKPTGIAKLDAAEDTSCLTEINAVRKAKASSLADLTWGAAAPTREGTETTVWAALDTYVKTLTCASIADGTFAQIPAAATDLTVIASTGETEKPTCKAAVEAWGKGFSLFDGVMPPVYKAATPDAIYAKRGAVEFITLVSDVPTKVVCAAVAGCPAAETTTSTAAPGDATTKPAEATTTTSTTSTSSSSSSSSSSASEEGEVDVSRAEASRTLICAVAPAAIKEDKAPFTKATWDALVASSAAHALPSVFSAAAVAVVAAFAFA